MSEEVAAQGREAERSGMPQTAAAMRAAVEARVQALAAEFPGGAPPEKKNGHTYRFLKSCLDANELGDGVLYQTLFEGGFLYNASSQQWLRWTGAHWEIDIEERAIGAVEAVAAKYLEMLPVIGEKLKAHHADKAKIAKLEKVQRKVIRRVSRLRTERGRRNCLRLAATGPDSRLIVSGEVFDSRPMRLACRNALVDLELGEAVAARPEDYILKAAPTEWRGLSEPCPLWERTLSEIFEAREEVISFLQRLLGYATTGLTVEAVLPIFQGVGRNGKSLIFDVLQHVLGGLVSPIPVEMLLDQGRARSAASPSPDIMALKGVRIAVASEPDDNRRFAMGRIKWLTGNDPLTGRWPNDKYPVTFAPSHKLFLLTNDLPHAAAHDYAFWERVCVVPFRLSFVNREPARDFERRADLGLLDKLKTEASGILSWLVRGCLEWQRSGLAPPESVREATSRYKADEDFLQDWIDECCILDPYAATNASKLYDNFAAWYVRRVNKNPKKTPSQRAFGQMLSKRFRREKKGSYVYYGIDCDEAEEDAQMPLHG